ncbi:hypothetical protein ACQ4M4_23030 [Leptolyngbya sp. AN02str]
MCEDDEAWFDGADGGGDEPGQWGDRLIPTLLPPLQIRPTREIQQRLVQ